MSELIGLMFTHRVQKNVYGADNVATRSITITAGTETPAGAKKFTLLLAGMNHTAGSGGVSFRLAFTQGGDPLPGSIQGQNSQNKLWKFDPQGVEFDISSTALTITMTASAAATDWGFWVVGFWT